MTFLEELYAIGTRKRYVEPGITFHDIKEDTGATHPHHQA